VAKVAVLMASLAPEVNLYKAAILPHHSRSFISRGCCEFVRWVDAQINSLMRHMQIIYFDGEFLICTASWISVVIPMPISPIATRASTSKADDLMQRTPSPKPATRWNRPFSISSSFMVHLPEG